MNDNNETNCKYYAIDDLNQWFPTFFHHDPFLIILNLKYHDPIQNFIVLFFYY